MNIELYVDASGEHRFRVKAADGRVALKSEGYTSKSSARNGVDSVKKNGTNNGNYTKGAGGLNFSLKAGNGQVIGTSPTYGDSATADAMIEEMIANVENAPVEEV